jgi:hypothetical protein
MKYLEENPVQTKNQSLSSLHGIGEGWQAPCFIHIIGSPDKVNLDFVSFLQAHAFDQWWTSKLSRPQIHIDFELSFILSCSLVNVKNYVSKLFKQ